jgi:hypothetical protein
MDALHDTAHRPLRHRARWVWWLFAASALYYLLTEHRAHVPGLLGWLPLGFLLLCPLLHMSMHGGHGGHGAHGQSPPPGSDTNATASVPGINADDGHHHHPTER